MGSGTTYEYLQTMSGLDDSYEWWGGAVDGRYLMSYESGDDHFDWTEGYKGRNQFLIAFQSQRLVPAPGTGVFSADPRGFEGDGCDPAVAGCTLADNAASAPFSMPVWANFTLIGPGPLASIPSDGNGSVLRRGTGGTLFNGVMGRWKGIALNIRDAWTDTLFEQRDSLNIANLVLAQNGFNFDTLGGTGFALDTKFGPANAIQGFRRDRCGGYAPGPQPQSDGARLDAQGGLAGSERRERAGPGALYGPHRPISSAGRWSRPPTLAPPIRTDRSGGKAGPRTTSTEILTPRSPVGAVLEEPAGLRM